MASSPIAIGMDFQLIRVGLFRFLYVIFIARVAGSSENCLPKRATIRNTPARERLPNDTRAVGANGRLAGEAYISFDISSPRYDRSDESGVGLLRCKDRVEFELQESFS